MRNITDYIADYITEKAEELQKVELSEIAATMKEVFPDVFNGIKIVGKDNDWIVADSFGPYKTVSAIRELRSKYEELENALKEKHNIVKPALSYNANYLQFHFDIEFEGAKVMFGLMPSNATHQVTLNIRCSDVSKINAILSGLKK